MSDHRIKLFITLLVALFISGCVAVAPASNSAPVGNESATATSAPTPVSTAIDVSVLTENAQGCLEEFDPTIDYFPQKISINHAQLFQVEYHNSYKVVRTHAEGEYYVPISASDVYILVQCGAPRPELIDDLAEATIITVPVERVSTGNNEEVAALIELGVADHIVSLGTPEYSSDAWHPKIKELMDDGTPVTRTAGAINLEAVVAAEPDVLFMLAWIGSQYENIVRARELGIATVGHHLWLEPTPLARAEWVKFFALFFNQEAAAASFFANVEQNYTTLSAQAQAEADKPTAIFADLGDSATVSSNDYLAHLLNDAGAINPFADPAGPHHPILLSLEEMVVQAENVDFWFTAQSNLLERASADAYRAVQQEQIYDHNKAQPLSGHSFYGDAIIRPDLLLQDFVSILHPELLADYETIFFQSLFSQE